MSEYQDFEPERAPEPKRTLVEHLKYEWYLMTYPEQSEAVLTGIALVVLLVLVCIY